MKKFKGIVVAVAFLVIGLGTVYGFEQIQDTLNTDNVVVLSQDLSFKDKITEEHLEVKAIPIEHITDNAIKPSEANKIIGGYAAIDIPSGFQITETFVDHHDLVPDESKGEFIAPIPEDWIFATPGTLRRSYIADFYTVSVKEQGDLLEQALDKYDTDELSDVDLSQFKNTV
ncbi:SAF domain-containing protein [Piscibacillus sp. B03]|uniref:SAF domain-containing protein n=1 Tax=Piscibacillus sp. B03 TaxID=3457430 RepID=UPI003FCC797C